LYLFSHFQNCPLTSLCCFFHVGKDEKDFYEQIPVIMRELIHRFNDQDTDVVKASNKAFAALSKHVPAEELVEHIEYLRNLIASMVSDARRRKGGVGDGEFLLPGFNIPKGRSWNRSFLLCLVSCRHDNVRKTLFYFDSRPSIWDVND
jgi:hypothetical protein